MAKVKFGNTFNLKEFDRRKSDPFQYYVGKSHF